MTPSELEHYLNAGIPLTRAMQISVLEAGEGTLVLRAPLAPNINQHATVFGGSASAVAILAAWSLLHVQLQAAGLAASIVIQRNTMEYLHPIQGEFLARAAFPEDSGWEQFTRMLARKGKGRMAVMATLECNGQVVGRFTGEFVALREEAH